MRSVCPLSFSKNQNQRFFNFDILGDHGMSKTGTGGSLISEFKGRKKESQWLFDFRMSEKPKLALLWCSNVKKPRPAVL
jgi:hypothetical protein